MILLNEKDIKYIKQNKITYVKNSITLKREFDFNLISKLVEENNLKSFYKIPKGDCPILECIFQIYSVSKCLIELDYLFDFLKKIFKYDYNERDEIDLFFSFISKVGEPHVDEEDVYIIGLMGTTVYRTYGDESKDYTIEKGDLIFIPKGIKHKVIGITPRIIASIGFYGKRLNG